jgi:hypothetical protein
MMMEVALASGNGKLKAVRSVCDYVLGIVERPDR